MDILLQKHEKLKSYIQSLGSLAVAFSGGVDSTFLLKTAYDVLKNKAIAITACSASFPKRELNEAICYAKNLGIKHIIFESEELKIDGFCQNPINRCYICKKEIFTKIIDIAKQNGIEHVAEGSNVDDNSDYRPGLAAVAELEVKSPLRYAELTKSEIRQISKDMALPTWDKQSFACLASRFVYGETITIEKLKAVEQAEQLLLDKGFCQVRVRIHGDLARIEVQPDQITKLLDTNIRIEIHDKLKSYGFSYISLDLAGYRTGSMNEILQIR